MIAAMMAFALFPMALAGSEEDGLPAPVVNGAASYTVAFSTENGANLKLGADLWFPVGESKRHEVFLAPEVSIKGLGGVLDIPLSSELPDGASGELTLGAVFFREPDSGVSEDLQFYLYDRGRDLCHNLDPKWKEDDSGDSGKLCDAGKKLYDNLLPDYASRYLPEFVINLGASLSRDSFTWRELDEQTTPATLGEEQSAEHPALKGTLNAAYVTKNSSVVLEVSAHVESAWSASGSTLSWCGTDEYQVGGQTTTVESCDESVLGAPSNDRSFGGSVAVGMVDEEFVWRWALQPAFESSGGDLTAGLGVPFYVNVTKLNNMSENSSKNILKFTPYVNIPLGVSPVEPRVGVAVSIYNGKQLVDPTLSNL